MSALSAAIRRHPYRWAAAAVALAVAGVVALALYQPWKLFVDDVVDEAFPSAALTEAAGDVVPEPDGGASVATTPSMPTADGPGAPTDAPTPDTGGTAAPSPTAEAEPAAPAPDAPSAPTDAPTDRDPAPVLLRRGEFVDRSHPTTGGASVHRLADGSRVLRLEELRTDNGPDLFVYLAEGGVDADVSTYDRGIDLGRLKGNIGSQNYAIPDDVDLDRFDTVVIWCDRFAVAFGAAQLAPA